MTTEPAFLQALQALATHPAARGFTDDAAVLTLGNRHLVFTHDMIVEGVHYLPSDPPDTVAWKLLAVNLSDLAAKGARPLGALLGYMTGDPAWDTAFLQGLSRALQVFDLPLLGGDTVRAPGTARALGLTAIGEATAPAPSRAGARPGHHLWVTGAIGDAGIGLRALQAGSPADASLVERYRTPRPRLEAGQRLSGLVAAMMDVSDGLLLDARRMAAASTCAVHLDLDAVPLSDAYLRTLGETREARLQAATAGDDYELLFAAPAALAPDLLKLSDDLGLSFTRIGTFEDGHGLALSHAGAPIPLLETLGYQH